jgi:hypothetical protein
MQGRAPPVAPPGPDFERRPFGGVREIRRCRNESRTNGIAKISRVGVGCRPDYVVVLQEFTYHDLRARAPKHLRAFILLVDHRANGVTSFKKMLDCVLAGLTSRADYQERLRAHIHLPSGWLRLRRKGEDDLRPDTRNSDASAGV